MTSFERAVLGILARANEPLGWYPIAIRLSNTTLDERPPLPRVLDDLCRREWIRVVAGDDGPTRHAITAAGRAAITDETTP